MLSTIAHMHHNQRLSIFHNPITLSVQNFTLITFNINQSLLQFRYKKNKKFLWIDDDGMTPSIQIPVHSKVNQNLTTGVPSTLNPNTCCYSFAHPMISNKSSQP